jgi:Photosynthetic reaction centre cytochrome C subunit
MNKLITLTIFFVILISITALKNEPASVSSDINNDSLEAEKKMYVDEIKLTIKGKEDLPSDSVFVDIQMLKNVPAGRLLGIMSGGFSKALGVGCDHCHNVNDFASNEKPQKQIAREMMTMSGKIREMLKEIKEITSENPAVTCTTCHRGSIVPATEIH